MPQPQRVVSFRPRTVLQVTGVLLAVAVALWVVYISRQVISWMFVALFLALAMNPAVAFLERRGWRRGLAVGAVFLAVAIVIAGLAALVIPPLVDQVEGFVKAVPGYLHDLTKGRGPLGFLERKYHIVERVHHLVTSGGGSKLAGGASAVLSITRSVITAIIGIVTIIFLTVFMLLEGPTWWERGLGLLEPGSRPRWRNVGHRIERTVSGYITGNLLLSLIAGVTAAIVLVVMSVPFPLALGLLTAILDLIPLAGATLAAIVLAIVGFLTSIPAGIVVIAYFIVYQQIENHLLQPLVYGRTVQLSPLVVLVAILVGAQIAGILGALGAIPVAGTLQILLLDWLAHRRRAREAREEAEKPAAVAAETVEEELLERSEER